MMPRLKPVTSEIMFVETSFAKEAAQVHERLRYAKRYASGIHNLSLGRPPEWLCVNVEIRRICVGYDYLTMASFLRGGRWKAELISTKDWCAWKYVCPLPLPVLKYQRPDYNHRRGFFLYLEEEKFPVRLHLRCRISSECAPGTTLSNRDANSSLPRNRQRVLLLGRSYAH